MTNITQLKIIRTLLIINKCRRKNLISILNLNATTINYNLHKMAKEGLLTITYISPNKKKKGNTTIIEITEKGRDGLVDFNE